MTGSPPLVLNVARPWGETDPLAIARSALASGLDGVGLADSPRLFPDCLLETARVLTGTEARLAGPCVLSLGLRHAVTVASAVRTLGLHHPGRVLTVVGRGESSVRNEDLPMPSLRDYEQSLNKLRDLLNTPGLPAAARVLGAASGPRTISLTAGCLGAVLIDVGADAHLLERAVHLARHENPATAVWAFLRVVLTATPEETAAAALPVLGSCATRLLRAPDWYGVPADLLPQVEQVAAAHDYRSHGTREARARADDGLAGADALVRDRFVVTGNAATIAERLQPVARLGINGVVLAGALTGVLERLPELATAVREGLTGDTRMAPRPGQ